MQSLGENVMKWRTLLTGRATTSTLFGQTHQLVVTACFYSNPRSNVESIHR